MKINQETLDKIVNRIKTGENLSDISRELRLNPGNLSEKLKQNGTPVKEIKPKKKDKTETKRCEECDTIFLRWHINSSGNATRERTFCSKSCSSKRKKNKNKRVKKICCICQKHFVANSNAGMYCKNCVLGGNPGKIFTPERITEKQQEKIKELPGKETEHEKVLSFLGFENRGYGNYLVFECECKHCGNKNYKTDQAIKKEYKSCSKCSGVYQDYEEITKRLWKSYITGAKTRGLDFSITMEQAWDLFITQDKKCALSGEDLIFGENGIKTASLDRIDSSKGYIEGNIQWVHKEINFLKGKMEEETLFGWIEKIYLNRIKNETKPLCCT